MELSHHHAYLIAGRIIDESEQGFLEAHDISIPPGTETLRYTYDTMGIDDARALFDLQLRRTSEMTATIFLIGASFLTREAQSAMLKMLEEPSPRTHFILVTPHPELLLATLRSRFVIIGKEPTVRDELLLGGRFLDGSYPERGTVAAEILEDANRSMAEAFLRSLTVLLHQRHAPPDAIARLEKLRTYATDPASSLKLILDYLTYALPL